MLFRSRAKLAVLRRQCEAIGRPFDDIERTAIGTMDIRGDGTSARAAIEYCRAMNDAGIQHLSVNMPRIHEISTIEMIGQEIIPATANF